MQMISRSFRRFTSLLGALCVFVFTIAVIPGVASAAACVPVITTDAYGRVSGVSNTAVNIDTSAIVSGTLGIGRGGTGASSFAVKGVIISDSASTTGAMSSLTSPTEGHVLQINSSGAPTFAHLNGGTF